MSRPAAETVPKLAPGCRLREAPGQPAMLLVPEGALKLTGSSLHVVQHVDGVRSFGQIVALLQAEFPEAAPVIEEQTAAFLEKLHERGAVRFA